jgi:hypothetical protein
VHDPQRAFGADVAAMTAAVAAMRHGRVEAGGPGRVLGFAGDELAVTGDRPGEVAIALADLMLAAGGELVTLIEGTAMDGEGTAIDGEDKAGDQAEGSIRSAPGGAAESLAELVAGHLRATSPAIETVCYGGGPARLPLLIGVE